MDMSPKAHAFGGEGSDQPLWEVAEAADSPLSEIRPSCSVNFLSAALAHVASARSIPLRSPHFSLPCVASQPLLPDARNYEYEHRCIIVPDRNLKFEAWTVYVAAVTVICVFLLPFEMTVLRSQSAFCVDLNLLIDFTFTVDMMLQFFVAIPNAQDSPALHLWERRHWRIARHYCAIPCSGGGRAGWFWIDLASVAPGWLELGCTIKRCRRTHMLKLFRIARVFRMMRLVAITRLMNRWHAVYGFPFVIVDLLKFTFITAIIGHWVACIWVMTEGKILQGFLSYQTDEATWLSALIDAKGDACTPDASSDPLCVYTIALYWSFMTVTSVGYGDIAPQNAMEYRLCSVFMLAAGFFWAYIVGSIVSLLSCLDPHAVKFKQDMDDLNMFMKKRHIPNDLQYRLRSYMHAAKFMTQLRCQQQLVANNLSKGLQRDLATSSSVARDLIRNIYWVKSIEVPAVHEIVNALVPIFLGPKEYVSLKETMLVVRRGLLAVQGKVLARGHIWGEDAVLLETQSLVNHSKPFTLSYVDIHTLNKPALRKICLSFPVMDRRIRKAQVRTAICRAFTRISSRVRVDFANHPDHAFKGRLAVLKQAMTSLGRIEVGRGSFGWADDSLTTVEKVPRLNVDEVRTHLEDLEFRLARRQEKVAEDMRKEFAEAVSVMFARATATTAEAGTITDQVSLEDATHVPAQLRPAHSLSSPGVGGSLRRLATGLKP